MRAQAKPRRRIWPFIIAAIVIIIVVIAVAKTIGDATGTPTATPTDSPSTSATTSPNDAQPTGCLGGETRDAAMIIAAVDQAPASESGAVDVAASFIRWIQRFPYPGAEEAAQVQSEVLAPESFTNDLVAYLAAQPDLSGGIVQAGTTYNMSTVPGVWYVESSSDDQVVVSIGTGYVINGELSTTLRSSITVTLVRQDNSWLVAAADGTRTPADLYEIGQKFIGGC